jgi:hypothetical protein
MRSGSYKVRIFTVREQWRAPRKRRLRFRPGFWSGMSVCSAGGRNEKGARNGNFGCTAGRPGRAALKCATVNPDSAVIKMTDINSVVAVFADHASAEAAVRKLADAGIDMKHLSVVGKGYHTDEKVIGFYNTGDRVKFWGRNGAFWGTLIRGASTSTVPNSV